MSVELRKQDVSQMPDVPDAPECPCTTRSNGRHGGSGQCGYKVPDAG